MNTGFDQLNNVEIIHLTLAFSFKDFIIAFGDLPRLGL